MAEGFPEHLEKGVPAHGEGWNKMAFKVPSHTIHSVLPGKQNPSEHPNTNFPRSEIPQKGHFPWGCTQGRGRKVFSILEAAEQGGRNNSLTEHGESRALQGSHLPGKLRRRLLGLPLLTCHGFPGGALLQSCHLHGTAR